MTVCQNREKFCFCHLNNSMVLLYFFMHKNLIKDVIYHHVYKRKGWSKMLLEKDRRN